MCSDRMRVGWIYVALAFGRESLCLRRLIAFPLDDPTVPRQ